MVQMRIREVSSCPEHDQIIVVLEDVLTGQRRLAIGVPLSESGRLVRELCDDEAKDPIYAFVEGLLHACETAATRVVLEYVPGAGLRGVVSLRRSGGDAAVPCYLSDALGLARRVELPVYVTPNAFSDDEAWPASASEATQPRDLVQWLERVKPGDFSSRNASRPAKPE